MELGKAKYGSGKMVFKLKDGDNVFRILPPMGKLAKSGKWNQYYRVEWGYKNSAGKNRPFQDVRVVNYDTKMVEVESAAHLRREALKAKMTELVAALRKDPTNVDLKKQVTDTKDAVIRFNLDSKYYVNVVDLNGQIGLLKIGYKTFKALVGDKKKGEKGLIDRLRDKGVDPISSLDNGRFFNFHRQGKGLDTQYTVTVYQENVDVNGQTYQKEKVHVIDQNLISRLDEEAFELSGMYPEVTASQVERMVKEGATAVDEILGAGNTHVESEDDEVAPEETLGSTATERTPTETSFVASITSVPVAPTVSAPVAISTTTTVPPTAVSSTMSTDEFLKSIGAL